MLAGAAAQAEARRPPPAVRRVRRPVPGAPLGILVPHAGLVYSGLVAAAGWRLVPGRRHRRGPGHEPHRGLAPRRRRLGGRALARRRSATSRSTRDARVRDPRPRAAVRVDRDAHRDEHSIEVQLPLLRVRGPGRADRPARRGRRDGERRDRRGRAPRARSSPRVGPPAHRSSSRSAPTWRTTRRPTRAPASRRRSCPRSWGCFPGSWHARGGRGTQGRRRPGDGLRDVRHRARGPGPRGAARDGRDAGVALASATSADAGADPRRTVGYLAVAFGG